MNGWKSVKEYFKGDLGAGKARKLIKFLNMLVSMDEDDLDDDEEEEI